MVIVGDTVAPSYAGSQTVIDAGLALNTSSSHGVSDGGVVVVVVVTGAAVVVGAVVVVVVVVVAAAGGKVEVTTAGHPPVCANNPLLAPVPAFQLII